MGNENCKDVRKFVLLEKELGLFDHSYNGFYYWQNLRFAVCESLFGNRTVNEAAERRSKKKKLIPLTRKLLNGIAAAAKLRLQLLKRKQYDIIFLRGPAISDKFFDCWSLPEGMTSANIRYVPYFKEDRNDIMFLEAPRLRSAIENKLRRRFRLYKPDLTERSFLKKLEKLLKRHFGQSLSAAEMEQLIQDHKVIDKHYSRSYHTLFRQTKCRAIVLTCYYNQDTFAALKTAKKMNVVSVELQHGVINNHEEYWFEDDRAKHNYMPDWLLTFGDIHNSWIKLAKGEQVYTAGFPFQEKSISELKNILPDEKTVVVYPESFSRFEETVNEFINMIIPLGYRVLIKLHPLQAENIGLWYPLLSGNKNAEFITSQDKGIYYWLKTAKHHVMGSTTVGLEAVVLDHPNICIAENIPHDQVQCLIDWKLARGFSTAEQLKELVLSPLDMNTPYISEIRKKLWKENASQNMTDFFRRLKNNNWKADSVRSVKGTERKVNG